MKHRKYRIADFIEFCTLAQQKLSPMLSLADANNDIEESYEIDQDLKDIVRTLTWLDTIKDRDRPPRE